MKKTKRISVIAILILLFSLTLAACNKQAVQEISVKAPTKTEYTVGDTLDITGGEITVKHKKGEDSVIGFDAEGVSYSPKELTEAGDAIKITVTYKDKTDSFNVSVKAAIAGISIEKAIDKTTYLDNETLELTGGKVRITYADDSFDVYDINDGRFTVTAPAFNSAGDKTITVELKSDTSKKTSFTVNIQLRAIDDMQITAWPQRYVYYNGQKNVDFADGEIALTYKDGTDVSLNMDNPLFTLSAFDTEGTAIAIADFSKTSGVKIIRLSYASDYVEIPVLILDIAAIASYAYAGYDQVVGLAGYTLGDATNLLFCYYELVDMINSLFPEDQYASVLDNFADSEYQFTAVLYEILNNVQIPDCEDMTIMQMYDYAYNFIYGRYDNGNYVPNALRWGLIAATDSEEFNDFVDYYVECVSMYLINQDLTGIDIEKLFSDFLKLTALERYSFLSLIDVPYFEYQKSIMEESQGVFVYMLQSYSTSVKINHGTKFFDGFVGAVYSSEAQAIAAELQSRAFKYRGTEYQGEYQSILGSYAEIFTGYVDAFEVAVNAMIPSDKQAFLNKYGDFYDSCRSDAYLYSAYFTILDIEYEYSSIGYDPIYYVAAYREFIGQFNSLRGKDEFESRLDTEVYHGYYLLHQSMSTYAGWLDELESYYDSIIDGIPAGIQDFVEDTVGLLVLMINDEIDDSIADIGTLFQDFLALNDTDKFDLFKFLDSSYGLNAKVEFFTYSQSLLPLFHVYFTDLFDGNQYEELLDLTLSAIEHNAAYAANGSKPANSFAALDYSKAALALYEDLKADSLISTNFSGLMQRLQGIKDAFTVTLPAVETITGMSWVDADTIVYSLDDTLDYDSVYIRLSYDGGDSVVRLNEEMFTVSGFNSAAEGIKTVSISLKNSDLTAVTFKVFVMDYKALSDFSDSLEELYANNDTTPYVLALRAFKAKLDYYLTGYDYQSNSGIAAAVEQLIKKGDYHNLSLYGLYEYGMQMYGRVEYWLKTDDLKEFYAYYLECAATYLADGDVDAVALWEKYLLLTVEEQYYFMNIIDASGFEANYFVYLDNDLIRHNYSVLFDDTDNNIFSNIIFEHYYEKMLDLYGEDFAIAVNMIMLMTELRITYLYWIEYNADADGALSLLNDIYLFYSIYLSNLEQDFSDVLENANFEELFGAEYDFLYNEFFRIFFGAGDIVE